MTTQPGDPDDDDGGGRPDFHDPTARVTGAPPATSALTLRLALALFGLLVCGVGGGVALALGVSSFAAVLWVLAAIAVADLLVVRRRMSREGNR